MGQGGLRGAADDATNDATNPHYPSYGTALTHSRPPPAGSAAPRPSSASPSRWTRRVRANRMGHWPFPEGGSGQRRAGDGKPEGDGNGDGVGCNRTTLQSSWRRCQTVASLARCRWSSRCRPCARCNATAGSRRHSRALDARFPHDREVCAKLLKRGPQSGGCPCYLYCPGGDPDDVTDRSMRKNTVLSTQPSC